MAIPQKGSRTIIVDGMRYLWRIRRKPTYCEGAFADPFSVAVQREDLPSGSVLLLATSFPRPDNWLGRAFQVVTPAMVAVSIKRALADGWRPERRGPCFKHPLCANRMDR